MFVLLKVQFCCFYSYVRRRGGLWPDTIGLEKTLNEKKTLNLVDGDHKVSTVLKKMFSLTANILLLKGKHPSTQTQHELVLCLLQHQNNYKAVFRPTLALCEKMPPPHLFESHCCIGNPAVPMQRGQKKKKKDPAGPSSKKS